MTKVLIDQTLGAAVNTVAWLVGVKALRGASLDECIGHVKDVCTHGLRSQYPIQGHEKLEEGGGFYYCGMTIFISFSHLLITIY